MAQDLACWFGQDLNVSASGDLLTVDGVDKGRQRVLRRLLTNGGSYIWESAYGAGLASKIGQPFSADGCKALVQSQIYLEAAVARTPAPTIAVTQVSGGGLYVQISYFDSATGQVVPLSFTVTPPST